MDNLNPTCFFDNCKTAPISFCPCTPTLIFMCQNHIERHFEQQTGTTHLIKPMYRKIDLITKNFEIKKYNELIVHIKRCEDAIAKLMSNLTASLTKIHASYTKYFKENTEKLKKLLEIVSRSDKELAVPGMENENYNERQIAKHFDDIISTVSMACDVSIDRFEKVTSSFKGYKSETTTKMTVIDTDEHLFFFKPGTRTLVKFDSNDLVITENLIQVELVQGSLAGICQLNQDKIFVYGGYSPYANTAFIVNLNNFTIEPLPRGRTRACASATLSDNCIFFFGGICKGSTLDFCDKFDLDLKEWVNIASPPFPISNSTVINLKKFFIISNNTEHILKYNVNENTYDLLSSGLPTSSNKILIQDGVRFYLLSNSSIYMSIEKNMGIWEKLDKELDVGLVETTSKCVYKGKIVYFYVNYGVKRVYRFDLDKLDLQVVHSIF